MFVLRDVNHTVCEMCATEGRLSRIVMIFLRVELGVERRDLASNLNSET